MDKTFIKITNKDIYELLMEFKDANQKQHNEIIQHQITTNGKVKLNRWISMTALSAVMLVGGWLASHLLS